MEKFFIGWHQPGNGRSSGKNFDYAIYSINRLEKRLTLQNYQQLKSMVNSTYIMPVLQGFKVTEYLQHSPIQLTLDLR